MHEELRDKLLNTITTKLKTDEEILEKAHLLLLDEIKYSYPQCIESQLHIKDRILRARKLLKEEAEKLPAGKKLAVVSHWGFIWHFTAKSFGHLDKAEGGVSAENCEVIEYVFD